MPPSFRGPDNCCAQRRVSSSWIEEVLGLQMWLFFFCPLISCGLFSLWVKRACYLRENKEIQCLGRTGSRFIKNDISMETLATSPHSNSFSGAQNSKGTWLKRLLGTVVFLKKFLLWNANSVKKGRQTYRFCWLEVWYMYTLMIESVDNLEKHK